MSKIIIQPPDQYLHELQAWERLLDFYKQENAYLKMHLAKMIDKYSDVSFVEPAEYFNNKFVFIDEYMLALYQDLKLQFQLLQQYIAGDHSQELLMSKMQARIGGEMEKFEQEITDLTQQFNMRMNQLPGIS